RCFDSQAVYPQLAAAEHQRPRATHFARQAARRAGRIDLAEQRPVEDRVGDPALSGYLEVRALADESPIGGQPRHGALEERPVMSGLVGHVEARVESERAGAETGRELEDGAFG